MATPAAYQRLGVGRSLLAQVIAGYRRQGVSRFCVWGTNAGIRLYQSPGFETIGEYSFWTSGA
jgi:ribosomal protein S18 acetylase RimI-like enzyme